MAASDIDDATLPGAMFYTPSAVGVTRDDGVEHVLFIYGLWRSWGNLRRSIPWRNGAERSKNSNRQLQTAQQHCSAAAVHCRGMLSCPYL